MIERLLNILNSIPDDKAKHALGGVILFALGNALGGWQVGLILCAWIGVIKELLYDYFRSDHQCDFWDFVTTCAGGALGLSCLYLRHALVSIYQLFIGVM
jgi:hypothetical protein